MSVQGEKLKAIADAIRVMDGTTAPIVANTFPERIKAIKTGVDTGDATATSADILSGKTAYVKGNKVTGSIVSKGQSDLQVSGATITTPAGYYPAAVSKSVNTVSHPNPTLTLDTSNSSYAYIRANHAQSTGYVSGGTTTGSYAINRFAGGTYYIAPGTGSQLLLNSGLWYVNNALYAYSTQSGVSLTPITVTLSSNSTPYGYGCQIYQNNTISISYRSQANVSGSISFLTFSGALLVVYYHMVNGHVPYYPSTISMIGDLRGGNGAATVQMFQLNGNGTIQYN